MSQAAGELGPLICAIGAVLTARRYLWGCRSRVLTPVNRRCKRIRRQAGRDGGRDRLLLLIVPTASLVETESLSAPDGSSPLTRWVVNRIIMKTKISLLFLCFIISACSQSFRTPGAPELVIRLMEVWESGHLNSLAEFVDSSAVYDDVPNNYRFEGIEGFETYLGHVHNWASEVSMTIDETGGSTERAYAEWTMTGRQSRPIEGRIPVATDSTFTLKGLTLVEVENGKIIRAADYIDVLGFILQLGSTVELPGGVVIGKSK